MCVCVSHLEGGEEVRGISLVGRGLRWICKWGGLFSPPPPSPDSEGRGDGGSLGEMMRCLVLLHRWGISAPPGDTIEREREREREKEMERKREKGIENGRKRGGKKGEILSVGHLYVLPEGCDRDVSECVQA